MDRMGRLGNQWLESTFKKGRKAGSGVLMDDYSEESGNPVVRESVLCRFPSDGKDPKDLDGPVIIVRKGRRHDAV